MQNISFIDINECDAQNECHANADCSNSIGSYECICRQGYAGNGTECSGI